MRFNNATGRAQPQNPDDRLRVVTGHEGLLVPAFVTAHDEKMAFMYRDTINWFNRLVQINGDKFVEEQFGNRVIEFDEPTTKLAIRAVESSLGFAQVIGDGFEYGYDKMGLFLDSNDEYYDGIPKAEDVKRIQPVLHKVLEDLGYGDPETFMERSEPLADIRPAAAA